MMGDDFNLYTHFAPQFARNADKALLHTGDGQSWRYRDIDEQSQRFATCLSELGLSSGDHVSVQVAKSPAGLGLYLACLRAGFVYHPLNMAYTTSELEYFLANAEPAAVVCDPDRAASIRPLAGLARDVLTLAGDGSGTLAQKAQGASADFATVRRDRDDVAALLYSSGTTGLPKGIMLTHGNLLSNTEALVEAWGFTLEDRLLHALPMFHVHGLFVGIGCVLASGASMRWLASFKIDEVIRCLSDCTVMMGVPTYYTRMLAHPGLTRDATRKLRLFVSGSAPLLTETFEAFEAKTGHRILERYGMTETNMNTSNPLDGPRKPGTVGPPLAGVEVRITDDEGRLLEPGAVGNLLVRGPNVFIGYWKLPDKTAEDFTDDGFFKTGDKGMVDEDGYVTIVGRARDMVITGGLNVYPKEVELILDELAGIRESAVIGVPHPDLGEGVVAVVVREPEARLEEAAIIGHCRSRLAGFKLPKAVVLVDELPRNTMAKVQKNVLRETYSNLFSEAISSRRKGS